MSQTTTFVPSGTPVSFTAPDAVAASFALPTVDGSNLDVTIQNGGISPVWFGFGTRAPTSSAADAMVQPGQTVLFTANAAVLAASAANPLVVAIGAQLSGAVTIMAVAQQRGGTVTITRGTATSRPVF